MGHDNANSTMLRRSVQLLLRPENDHFEGIMPRRRERRVERGRIFKKMPPPPNSPFSPSLSFGRKPDACYIESELVIVLRSQEELDGP